MDRDQRDAQTYTIIGAAMEVHRELGCGYLEPVYWEPLAFELAMRGVPFAREVQLPIHHKGRLLPKCYRADFVCYNEIIVEVKALTGLSPREEAQLINYLTASKLKRGLLINFGARSLQYVRKVRDWRG